MRSVEFTQTSFNAGEFSPDIYGAVEYKARAQALALCENMIPKITGGIQRRGGLYFVKPSYTALFSQASTVAPVNYAQSNIWHIEKSNKPSIFIEAHARGISYFDSTGAIGHRYTGITATYSGVTSPPTVSFPDTGQTIVVGDIIHLFPTVSPWPLFLQDLFCRVIAVSSSSGTKTLTLDLGDTYTYDPLIYGPTISIRLSVVYTKPYPAWFDLSAGTYQDLSMVDYVQDKDTLFLVAPGFPPTSLAKINDSNDPFIWTQLTLNDGPYLSINLVTATKLYYSTAAPAFGSTVTVTATSTTGINGGAGFTAGDVGRLLRQRATNGSWYWFKISVINSTTSVNAVVQSPNGATNLPLVGSPSDVWRLGAWSNSTGYPSVVSVYQDRMFFGNVARDPTNSYPTFPLPDRYDFSESSGFSFDNLYMAPTNEGGVQLPTSAGYGELPGAAENAIQWFSPTLRGMLVGTSRSEYQIIGAGNNTTIITPATVIADTLSATRSYPAFAILVGVDTIYIQYSGNGLFRMAYSFDDGQVKPVDISLTFQHLLDAYADGGTINPASLTFQFNPGQKLLWTAPGKISDLVGVLFDRDQGVSGAFRVNYEPISNQEYFPSTQVFRVPDVQAAPSLPLDILAVNVYQAGLNITSVSATTTPPLDGQRSLINAYGSCLQAPQGVVVEAEEEVGMSVYFNNSFAPHLNSGQRLVDIPCHLDYSLLRRLRRSSIPEYEAVGDTTRYYYIDGCHHLNISGDTPVAPFGDRRTAQVLVIRPDGSYFWHPDVTVGIVYKVDANGNRYDILPASGVAMLDSRYFIGAESFFNFWRVYIGIQSPSKIQTMPFGGTSDTGAVSQLISTLDTCKLRLIKSQGIKYGSSDSDLVTWTFGQSVPVSFGSPVTLVSGDTDNIYMSQQANTFSQAYFVFDTPFPMFITSILSKYTLPESL